MHAIRLDPNRCARPERFHRPWGCPLTKNRTPWCFGICAPAGGLGHCGRVAPHALVGRTDGAIRAYLARKAAGPAGA